MRTPSDRGEVDRTVQKQLCRLLVAGTVGSSDVQSTTVMATEDYIGAVSWVKCPWLKEIQVCGEI